MRGARRGRLVQLLRIESESKGRLDTFTKSLSVPWKVVELFDRDITLEMLTKPDDTSIVDLSFNEGIFIETTRKKN